MRQLLAAAAVLLTATQLPAQTTTRIPIETGQPLQPVNVALQPVDYHGRKAIQVIEAPRTSDGLGEAIAIIPRVTFKEGIIELDVAGFPGPHAAPDDRGFIGLAFHIAPDREKLKTFYLRPTNGRAEDQLRRNHAAQFTADPNWPWHRLRKEQPGQYESYVDLVAGEWTTIRAEISGTRAAFYVNNSSQPVLLVTDMKDPVIAGGIALWIGSGTEGYFSNLRVTPR